MVHAPERVRELDRSFALSAACQAGARDQAAGMTPALKNAPLISIAIGHDSLMSTSPLRVRLGGRL
jgi:hypothetical protein